ncbi:hypothetical protein K457DRAFT_136326 [Linnemannia elongata AG-77]|uniref:Cas12f1-like TNB domain-containing protein n=1 Tax=Linnemannia elongata AG-77 TaxID=1314771 RepID=A0A197K1R4_9FUNG|nr:hypothetical protein K457DRAFT_136326 [Linnemannia elongata AG-77]
MKILTLDAGQACPIGAYAYLPNGLIETDKGKEKANQGAAMEGVITTDLEPSVDATSGPSSMPDVASSSSRAITADSTSVSAPSPAFDVAYTSAQEQATDPDPGGAPSSSSSSPVHFNLAIKQKAVYQPVFRFRRWLEHEKSLVPEGQDESIHSLESHLPPLRGHSASVIEYARELEEVEERLKTFYTGDHHRFNRSKWDMSRARHEEYQLMAERLLNIVGGSLGRRIEDNKEQDPVLIGVGLGQFESNIKLSSLDSTFLAYFIRTVRSLGYIVLGINEYYTSRKCPRCTLFVAQVTLRSLYCFNCSTYFHRDVLAAENMSLIVRERLKTQTRPRHLQPINADGSLPWEAVPDTGPTVSSSSAEVSSSSKPNPSHTRRKRTTTASSQGLGRRGEKAARV